MPRNAFAVVASDVNRQPRRRASSSASWGGADQSRLMADWLLGSISSDSEIRANLTILRARARDLVKNNAWCTGFVDEVKNNVVGEAGIMLQARIRMRARVAGEVPELATATNREIERGWKEWSHCEYASANRRYSLVDIEDLLIETVVTDGEAFVRRLRGFDNDFGYALQFVDADLVDEKFSRAAGPNVNEVRMGVELDRYGAVVGYHVWNRYLSDASSIPRRREFISADDMLHIFVPMRANQVRGITWFAPIMVKARHMDGYEESELVAARAGASKMGFIVNTSAEAISNFEAPKPGAEPQLMDMEPGVIKTLLPGEEYQESDPKHPSTAFEMFTSTVLRAMARGLKVSYLTLTGDLRAANYSSMRAGLLPERDRWRKLHGFIAEHFCRPIYRDWIRMALLAGAVRVDSRLASEYFEVEWKGRGWKWVDPVNDLAAAEKEIGLGINSRQRLAAERGVDYEEVILEIEHEEQFADEHDVDVSGTLGKAAAPAPAKAVDPLRPDGSEPANEPLPGNEDDADADARATSEPKLAVVGGRGGRK